MTLPGSNLLLLGALSSLTQNRYPLHICQGLSAGESAACPSAGLTAIPFPPSHPCPLPFPWPKSILWAHTQGQIHASYGARSLQPHPSPVPWSPLGGDEQGEVQRSRSVGEPEADAQRPSWMKAAAPPSPPAAAPSLPTLLGSSPCSPPGRFIALSPTLKGGELKKCN